MFLATKFQDVWAIKLEDFINIIGHNAYNM